MTSAPTEPAPADVFLLAGEFYFGSGCLRISTVLGTCIAITLWHPLEHRGGMCHFLLPARGSTSVAAMSGPGFYAEEVMGLFADELRASRTEPRSYIVKIFGGGHMFPDVLTAVGCRNNACSEAARTLCTSVGCQNIRSARDLLLRNGFTIASEDVGGHGSRQLRFDLWSGNAWVKHGAAMSDADRSAP